MKEYYRQIISNMLPNIKSERFLCQIYNIVKRHVDREGDAGNE